MRGEKQRRCHLLAHVHAHPREWWRCRAAAQPVCRSPRGSRKACVGMTKPVSMAKPVAGDAKRARKGSGMGRAAAIDAEDLVNPANCVFSIGEDLLLLILQPSAALSDAAAIRHVLAVSGVCKAWHEAATSELLWRQLCVRRWPSTCELPFGAGGSFRSLYRRRAVPAATATQPLLSLYFLLEVRQPGRVEPVVS
eukprot:3340751-Prymnesium_polylepis.1